VSDLLRNVEDAINLAPDYEDQARDAVKALIKEVEIAFAGAPASAHDVLTWLRNELDPPPEAEADLTPTQVLADVWRKYSGYEVSDANNALLFTDMVDALKEHGMLKETS